MRRLLSRDPLTGKTQYFEHDYGSDSFRIVTSEDIEPVLAMNHEQKQDAADDWKGDVHKVASLPMSVYMDLKQKGIVDDERAFRRWLNDPDNAVFRTRRGKV